MPYKSINELPEGVRNVLPSHAQEIYRKAYNSAHNQYQTTDARRGDDSQEEVAHKVAWSAVKKAGYYKQDNGSWYKD